MNPRKNLHESKVVKKTPEEIEADMVKRTAELEAYYTKMSEWEFDGKKLKVICQHCEKIGEIDFNSKLDHDGWALYEYEYTHRENPTLNDYQYLYYWLCKSCDQVIYWENHIPDTDEMILGVYRSRGRSL